MPAYSGIFIVYDTIYNLATDTVSLQKIIYIGEAENIRERIENHDMLETWKQYAQPGNELSFSAAHIDSSFRTRIKAAFIYHFKPPANSVFTDKYLYPPTRMVLSGKTAWLKSEFEVM